MMKKIIIIIALLFIPCLSFAQTHIPPGDVSGTWTIDGSPYIIEGHISVPVDSTLIIEPGVNIFFPEQNHFRVYGRLLAIGAESDTISFTASDTTDIFAGLYFCETDTSFQDSSKLKHCRFDPGCVGFSNSSRAIVKNCIVTNGYGIGFNNSSPTILDVTISNNTSESYGGGISCTNSSNPSLVNVTICGNKAMWGGGISCRFDSNPTLEGVTIMNNTAETGAGAGMFCEESSPILNNVTIAENEGNGFCCSDGSHPRLNNVVINGNVNGIYSTNSSPIITNIVISGNNGGGGAYFGGTDTVLVKNFEITGNSLDEDNIGGGVVVCGAKMIMVNGIIADNYAFDAGGIYGQEVHLSLTNVTICDNNIDDWGYVGGIGLNYYCKLDMTNCILWNNELNELVFMGTGCAWNINYCDIEDEISPGTGNISINPLFTDTIYHLSEDSPCIDAGDPDTIYYDIEDPENPGFALYPAMGTLINDMGAYGGHGKYIFDPPHSVDDPPHSQSMTINNYPNPFQNTTTLSYYQTTQLHSVTPWQANLHELPQINIYNLKGQLIRELECSASNLGFHSVWDGKDDRGKKVGAGMYFIYIKNGENVHVKKIVKLDR